MGKRKEVSGCGDHLHSNTEERATLYVRKDSTDASYDRRFHRKGNRQAKTVAVSVHYRILY